MLNVKSGLILTSGLATALLASACGTKTVPSSSSTTVAATTTAKASPGASANAISTTLGSGTTAPANPSVAALYAQCGNMNTAAPDQTIFSQQMGGVDIVQSGSQSVLGFPINYTVTVAPALTLQASTDQAIFTTSFSVNATPAAAQSTAEQTVNQSAGATTSIFTPLDNRANLATLSPAWASVLCTLQPTQQISSTVGGGNTVVAFNPPIPNSVPPLAPTARYASELAAPLTFSNIQATVQQTTNTAITAGSTYSGTVTVTSISPTYTGTTGEGQPVTVDADLAYQVSVNFGSAAITAALGLQTSTSFYIDLTTHTYKAIVSQTNSTAAPIVTFISN